MWILNTLVAIESSYFSVCQHVPVQISNLSASVVALTAFVRHLPHVRPHLYLKTWCVYAREVLVTFVCLFTSMCHLVFLQLSMLVCARVITLHYGKKAMGAMTFRISELYLSFSPHPNISDGNFNLVHHFFRIQIFQINEKGSRWAWIRWRRRKKWKKSHKSDIWPPAASKKWGEIFGEYFFQT